MKAIVVTLVLMLAVLGCGRKTPVKSNLATTEVDYWSLPDSAVVVKVNEYGLTKGENERRINLQIALAKALNRKFDNRRESSYRAKLLKESEFAYVQDVVLTAWGKRYRVELTDSDLLDGRARFAKSISRGKMRYETIRDLLTGVKQQELDEFVDRATYVNKCIDLIVQKNEIAVKSGEVAQRRKSLVDYNRRVASTNDLVWASASNLWKRVQADASAFDREVAKYQENEAEHVFSDPDMGEVSLSFFDDDPVWEERLAKAKEGDVLPPRIGDNGVLMIKILKSIPISEQENGKEPRWRLAKMFWELGAEWEPQSDDELLADLKTIRRREARARGLKPIFETAKVSYPSGTNLLQRTRKQKLNVPDSDRIPAQVLNKIEQGGTVVVQ